MRQITHQRSRDAAPRHRLLHEEENEGNVASISSHQCATRALHSSNAVGDRTASGLEGLRKVLDRGHRVFARVLAKLAVCAGANALLARQLALVATQQVGNLGGALVEALCVTPACRPQFGPGSPASGAAAGGGGPWACVTELNALRIDATGRGHKEQFTT